MQRSMASQGPEVLKASDLIVEEVTVNIGRPLAGPLVPGVRIRHPSKGLQLDLEPFLNRRAEIVHFRCPELMDEDGKVFLRYRIDVQQNPWEEDVETPPLAGKNELRLSTDGNTLSWADPADGLYTHQANGIRQE